MRDQGYNLAVRLVHITVVIVRQTRGLDQCRCWCMVLEAGLASGS